MSMIAQTAENKMKQKKSPFLDDSVLFLTLESLGMVSESKLIPSKKPTKKSVQEQLVCDN